MKTYRNTPVLLLLAVATGPWVLAQRAPSTTATTPGTNPPTTAASATPTEDEVTVLTPFEVSTTKDTGYAATQTLAGTRIRTDLKDVGASISVITKELLNDIGATDTTTLLQYTTNAEVAGTRGTYAGLGNGTSVDESANLRAPASAQRVRGLAAADLARDFYITDIPWDSFNVDRIEILRGPNSILYGLGSPAGIVNASTRTAEFRNLGSVDLRTGSYGTARGSLDFNQQIVPGVLAVRVDGLWNDKKFEQKQAFENDKRLFGSVRFDPQLFRNPAFRTSIKAKWEHGEINADRPRIIPPNDSITRWWDPIATASNPYGGAGKTLVTNPYDAIRSDIANITPGDGRGVTWASSTSPNYVPWIQNQFNQQQPYWLIDGTTNQLYGVNGGYINNGALYKDGTWSGASGGLVGKRQNEMFYGLTSFDRYVTNAHAANPSLYPDAGYGQYRTMSLLDPTVFDFYHNLIDGPTKWETENWNAYNLDLTQTGWNDRVGIDLTYDRQKYRRANESLIGGSPTLTIDILKNNLDFYLKGADGRTSTTNSNVGRPYVLGGGGNGGSSYSSDHEYKRASVFAELRAADFLQKGSLLEKILGKHRFNGVAADEKFTYENRSWQTYANSQAWAGYWAANDGTTTSIQERPPTGVIYLGSSLLNRSSASGANIPAIGAPVTLQDSGVYVFDTTWKNFNVKPGDPWPTSTWPSQFSSVIFDPNSPPYQSSVQYDQWYQNSNPANYVGWNSNFQDRLQRYNNGENLANLIRAQKTQRETTSYSGSYQGYLWNNALVTTLGWRYDKVKTKDVNAQNMPSNRNSLNLQPDYYVLSDTPDPKKGQGLNMVKGHSTSGGAVLHINRVLPRDFLPINVSLSYNESSNFQVTSVRRDVYGHPISNPSGKTYEYGALLSTKDNKYTFRVVKYTTKAFNASSTLSDTFSIGYTIQQGMKWRNVFLYQLGVYDWNSRNQPSYRNTWSNAYPLSPDAGTPVKNQLHPDGIVYTQALADADMNAAITGWNNIQKYLDSKGFFQAWNFTPTGPSSALVDRATYLSDTTKYAPDPNSVYQYSAAAPQGFAVTADNKSKGYEMELTANPLPNWRIAFNAAKTEAVQTNVGGASMADFVAYINSQLIDSKGVLTPAGGLPQFGGAGAAIYPAIWGPWLAKYTLLKLQEGADNPEIRKWRYNVMSNYDFRRGILKGVGVGAAYRWQDKVVIGYPVKTGGSFASYDLTKPYYGPAEDGLDLWVSYTRKLTAKINWKIQLNVYNVGQHERLIPISVEPDGHTWASVRIAPVQEWMLANTFSF